MVVVRVDVSVVGCATVVAVLNVVVTVVLTVVVTVLAEPVAVEEVVVVLTVPYWKVVLFG